MSDALDFFMDEERVIASLDFPDEGIDYVFMLDPSEWNSLLNNWESYSKDWRIGITYFAGFKRMEESGGVILKALREGGDELMLQAFFSLYQSLSDELEETKSIMTSFSDVDLKFINDSFCLANYDNEKHSEFKELNLFLKQLNR